MTCRQARKQLVDLLDAAAPEAPSEIHSHLAGCDACARELADMRAAIETLRPMSQIQASPEFKDRVMSRLTEPEPVVHKRFAIPRFVLAAATLAILLLLGPVLSNVGRRGSVPAPVLSLLAQSAQAMANAHSVHMIARMRTIAHDNFEYIDPALEWIPLEI